MYVYFPCQLSNHTLVYWGTRVSLCWLKAMWEARDCEPEMFTSVRKIANTEESTGNPLVRRQGERNRVGFFFFIWTNSRKRASHFQKIKCKISCIIYNRRTNIFFYEASIKDWSTFLSPPLLGNVADTYLLAGFFFFVLL